MARRQAHEHTIRIPTPGPGLSGVVRCSLVAVLVAVEERNRLGRNEIRRNAWVVQVAMVEGKRRFGRDYQALRRGPQIAFVISRSPVRLRRVALEESVTCEARAASLPAVATTLLPLGESSASTAALFPIGSHFPYVSTVSWIDAWPSWRCT